MSVLNTPFGFATRTLTAIDFRFQPGAKLPSPLVDGVGASVGNVGAQGQPSPLFTCPVGAHARIRGNCFGPAGALAYLAQSLQVFSSYAGGQHAMFPDALVIACGERIDFALNSGQTIWGLASSGPNLTWGAPDSAVILSFNWELAWYPGARVAVNGGYNADAPAAVPEVPGKSPGFAPGGYSGPSSGAFDPFDDCPPVRGNR